MFTQPCCPGFESRCAGCLGGEDSTKVRGLEGQARCLLGFSCLHGEQTLGLKCLTPQPVGPRRGNHAKQQSHRLSLLLSSPCQLTQDVARRTGDDTLASERRRGPRKLCDGRGMGRSQLRRGWRSRCMCVPVCVSVCVHLHSPGPWHTVQSSRQPQGGAGCRTRLSGVLCSSLGAAGRPQGRPGQGRLQAGGGGGHLRDQLPLGGLHQGVRHAGAAGACKPPSPAAARQGQGQGPAQGACSLPGPGQRRGWRRRLPGVPCPLQVGSVIIHPGPGSKRGLTDTYAAQEVRRKTSKGDN